MLNLPPHRPSPQADRTGSTEKIDGSQPSYTTPWDTTRMPTNAQVTDTVRASREGHWFHEAWTARKAMQLLLPMDGLIGIAVEGLSEEDQSRASAGTVEIADLTVYYGQDVNFRDADRVETLQFKYSPKSAGKPFRCSDAKKMIEKFAES